MDRADRVRQVRAGCSSSGRRGAGCERVGEGMGPAAGSETGGSQGPGRGVVSPTVAGGVTSPDHVPLLALRQWPASSRYSSHYSVVRSRHCT